jgi:protein tyrosine phosphatase (PTP) superfamily phosphohydrolase (DUF442 family)
MSEAPPIPAGPRPAQPVMALPPAHNRLHYAGERSRISRVLRFGRPPRTWVDRLLGWWDMMVLDHGILRAFYANLHRVADGVWRSNQPSPHQVRAFARRGGRTVVSLRGGLAFGSRPLEIEACERTGLTYRNLVFSSRSLPSRAELHRAQEFFRNLEKPALLHCKSGADRAGIASALYLMLAEGRPVAEAKRQLSLRYGHIRWSKTGVLDAFLEAYERDNAARPMPFMEWVDKVYDPGKIAAEFHETPLGSLIGDTLLGRE